MEEIKRLQEERKSAGAPERNSLKTKGEEFDSEIYGNGDDGDRYLQSLPTEAEENEEVEDEYMHPSTKSRLSSAREILDENLNSSEDSVMAGYREQFGSGLVDTRISNRESEVFLFCHGMHRIIK